MSRIQLFDVVLLPVELYNSELIESFPALDAAINSATVAA